MTGHLACGCWAARRSERGGCGTLGAWGCQRMHVLAALARELQAGIPRPRSCIELRECLPPYALWAGAQLLKQATAQQLVTGEVLEAAGCTNSPCQALMRRSNDRMLHRQPAPAGMQSWSPKSRTLTRRCSGGGSAWQTSRYTTATRIATPLVCGRPWHHGIEFEWITNSVACRRSQRAWFALGS